MYMHLYPLNTVFIMQIVRVHVKSTCPKMYMSIHAGRYRSKQIYELEMQRGHFDLAIDKVLMFGIAGSGKTSALAALLGVDPPSIRSSTPLMRRPIEVMFMDVNEELHWKMRTNKEFRDTVAEVIHSRMSLQGLEAQSSASPTSPSQQLSHTTPSSQSLGEQTNTSTPGAAGKSTPSSETKPTTRVPTTSVQSVAEVSLDSLLQSSEVEEEFVSLINSSPPSSKPILQLRQMLVLDSGGQPHLHELMPIFLNGASEFVYVFRIHDRLNERSMIRYFVSDELLYEFPASQTNEETLKQCTHAMSSLTAKNPDIPHPRWLFLGTHPDMVAAEELPGVLDTLHERLREILLPQFKERIVFCDSIMEDFIFTMNGKKPVKKDKECAEAIRKCLSGKKEGRKVVQVPLRWYALYQKLVEVSGGLGKKVLSRKQCGLVAESMKIDERSCEEALNFFNRLNMLFYFPDILVDLVFVEPQILLDKVTELVEESYRVSQGKKDGKFDPKSGEWVRFRDYGEVTEKFLSKFDSHYEAPLFTPKELVTLLKGLLVFADLSEDVYFMPCLLQVVSSEVVEKYQVSKERALAVHFPKTGPLIGMFCCTVAHLLSPEHAQWEVVKNEAGTPICLNRNVLQFTVPKVAGKVSLIDQFTHFEIHVDTHPKKTAQMWKLVHGTVFAGMKEARKTLGYDTVFAGMEEAKKTLGYVNNTPVPAIVCPAHPTTPHPATIDGDLVWTCSKGSGEFGDVPEGSLPWWTVCNTDGELLSSEHSVL